MGSLDLSDDAIDQTWNQVADMKEDTNWMALNYVDGKKKIGVKASGNGGLAELSEQFRRRRGDIRLPPYRRGRSKGCHVRAVQNGHDHMDRRGMWGS